MIPQVPTNERQPGELQAPSTHEEELMVSSFGEKRSRKKLLFGAWEKLLAGGWKKLLLGLLVGIALFAVGRWWPWPNVLGFLFVFAGGLVGGMVLRSRWALFFVSAPLLVGLGMGFSSLVSSLVSGYSGGDAAFGAALGAAFLLTLLTGTALIGAFCGIRIGKWLERRLTKRSIPE